MRGPRDAVYLLPLLAVFFVWIASRGNAIGVPLDTVFGPLLNVLGLQLTALIGAVIVGGIVELLFFSRIQTAFVVSHGVFRFRLCWYRNRRNMGELGNRTLLLVSIIHLLLRHPATRSNSSYWTHLLPICGSLPPHDCSRCPWWNGTCTNCSHPIRVIPSLYISLHQPGPVHAVYSEKRRASLPALYGRQRAGFHLYILRKWRDTSTRTPSIGSRTIT